MGKRKKSMKESDNSEEIGQSEVIPERNGDWKHAEERKESSSGKRATQAKLACDDSSLHLPPNMDPELYTILPTLPRDLDLAVFAERRAMELADLTSSVEEAQGGGSKRVFQKLPRHMRRRAMSRNAKRVPRWLREQHKKEIENDKHSKRPSRRHRRRPGQLLSTYNRRQRDFLWLETHIWHAKRFKMAERWGYKIPIHPSDKSVRASYRAASAATLIQDLSFYCCLQLSGPEQSLLDVLKEMTSQECGLTFGAKSYLSGCREGDTIVYRRNCYPNEAIAPVRFLWCPEVSSDVSSNERSLWIWVHPAAHAQLLSALTDAFAMRETITSNPPPVETSDAKTTPARTRKLRRPKKSSLDESIGNKNAPVAATTTTDDLGSSSKPRKRKKVDAAEKTSLLTDQSELAKLAPKLLPVAGGAPTFRDGHGVTLTVLKDSLVRLRLLGQMSTAVLTAVLRVDVREEVEGDDGDDVWWRRWNRGVQDDQAQLWSQLRAAPHSSMIAQRTVIGLVVSDPRVNLTIDRRKFHLNVPKVSGPQVPLSSTASISSSPLWDEHVRDAVTFSKTPGQEINAMRSRALVPGMPFDLGDEGCRIPLLAIQQPGTDSSHELGHGWDVIMPAGWAMAFWVPLIYHCARAGGIREQVALARESQTLHFPDDFPDTSAGAAHEELQRSQMISKYLKYPASKRPNFIKLAIAEPFTYPWQKLVSEWIETLSTATSEQTSLRFSVLRNRQTLRRLQRMLLPAKVTAKRHCPSVAEPEEDVTMTPAEQATLVCLRLRMAGRGQIREYATVCIPTDDDLKTWKEQPQDAGPVETLQPDVKRAARANNKKSVPKEASELDRQVADLLSEPSDDRDDFRRLYAPDYISLIRSASRTLIGYVKGGTFSLCHGHVTGLAFVSTVGLQELLRRTGHVPVVLVRPAHSSQYRVATFSIATIG